MTSSTVVPAELDTQSATWFEAVCTEMNVEIPAVEGDLPPQATVDYVKSLSAAMVPTAQIATTLPPPTIDGGAELATALAASMSSSGPDLAAKVDSTWPIWAARTPIPRTARCWPANCHCSQPSNH